MSWQMRVVSCQKDIFMVMEGGRPNWWEVREGRVFLECGEKWGWMWSWIGLNAFPKLPPFSPIDCAPKNALNEAFNFEFEFLAPYYPFWKCANPLFLTKGVTFVLCLCLSLQANSLHSKLSQRVVGPTWDPPTREKHHIVKNDQNTLSYLKCK